MFATSWFEVAVFFGIWAIIWLPIAALISRQIQWQPSQPLTTKKRLILILSLYLLAPAILWWQSKLEGLSFRDLGLDWQLSLAISFAWGLIISSIGLAVVFSIEFKFNLIHWHGHNWQLLSSLLVPIFCLSLAVGFVEELVFRGYTLQKLIVDFPYWLAATITSIIFALLHLVWERKQTIPQLPGLWLMGMVLVLARIVDRGSLGLAWGLHTGWIWGLTCIDSAELITYRGKEWITGIDCQPLAGVAGIFCLLATAIVLWLLSIIPDVVV